jgi:hypothetical protein
MNIPILGEAGGSNAPGLTARVEIHDSEIIEIERLLERLSTKAHDGRVDYAAFTREVRERFEDLGFMVVVNWYETNVEGTLIPEIVIRDRIEAGAFDHDQKVHEITHDLLDIGDGGVIKSNPEAFKDQEHGH